MRHLVFLGERAKTGAAPILARFENIFQLVLIKSSSEHLC
jgi:hypothetical protein